jgi:hypothetical protein
MLAILVMLFVFALIMVVPIMIGARMVGAEKTNFGAALFAVILLAVVGVILQKLGVGPIVGFFAATIVGAGVLAMVLGTTYLRGLIVSGIAAAVQVALALVAVGSMAVMAS